MSIIRSILALVIIIVHLRFVFGIAAVDLIARADYSDAEEVLPSDSRGVGGSFDRSLWIADSRGYRKDCCRGNCS